MLSKKYIVYTPSKYSPGDYYGIRSNEIGDIIGIFKTKESAEEFCKENNYNYIKISEIIWEE